MIPVNLAVLKSFQSNSANLGLVSTAIKAFNKTWIYSCSPVCATHSPDWTSSVEQLKTRPIASLMICILVAPLSVKPQDSCANISSAEGVGHADRYAPPRAKWGR